jgi:hypothetical protein
MWEVEMSSINSVSTPIYPSYSTPANSTVQTKPEESEQKGITIEITPGENNVDSGDRSQNTAVLSITTPENELQAEVTREEVFDAVERRHYKNIVDQAFGNDNNDNTLRKAAVVQNSEELDPYDIQQAAYLNVKQDQIDTYRTATENSIYNNDSSSSSSSSQNNDDLSAVQNYNEAKNAYMKQEFVFSTIDRVRKDISEII